MPMMCTSLITHTGIHTCIFMHFPLLYSNYDNNDNIRIHVYSEKNIQSHDDSHN